MSNLLGINEELKVFKCPQCNQFISSNNDICPKCSFAISNEQKEQAVKNQDKEVKEASRKFYRNNIFVGIGLFAIGGFLLIQFVLSYMATGRGSFFIWSPILTLFGLGQIIYGLNGLYKER